MRRGFPNWVSWAAALAGAMDAGTGVGLCVVPAGTLGLMGIAAPGAQALEYVRFVGVFVASVGCTYLLASLRRRPAHLRTMLDFTRLFRLAAGGFTAVMVFSHGWAPEWLVVSCTDLFLFVAQSYLLRRYPHE